MQQIGNLKAQTCDHISYYMLLFCWNCCLPKAKGLRTWRQPIDHAAILNSHLTLTCHTACLHSDESVAPDLDGIAMVKATSILVLLLTLSPATPSPSPALPTRTLQSPSSFRFLSSAHHTVGEKVIGQGGTQARNSTKRTTYRLWNTSNSKIPTIINSKRPLIQDSNTPENKDSPLAGDAKRTRLHLAATKLLNLQSSMSEFAFLLKTATDARL